MIELGGNINLDGFEALEPSQLVVVKKIAGNYAKKIGTKVGDFDKLLLIHSTPDSRIQIQAKLTKSEKITATEGLDPNLFFALDNALGKLLKEV